MTTRNARARWRLRKSNVDCSRIVGLLGPTRVAQKECILGKDTLLFSCGSFGTPAGLPPRDFCEFLNSNKRTKIIYSETPFNRRMAARRKLDLEKISASLVTVLSTLLCAN